VTVIQDTQVTIVGLGLMGGSLAGALKAKGACQEVIGVARRAETTALAVERGLVDRASTGLAPAVAEADAVVLATPVRAIIELLPQVGQLVKPGCLVMDLGSTKSAIVEAMSALPEHVQPVGGHPMCGKETSGLAAAEPNLYQGRVFVLTPLDRTDTGALDLARELVEVIGARPLVMGAERHDRLVAAVSHLPYLMACGLVRTAEELAREEEDLWQLAASGFRDSSRLAASGEDMMLDILLTNREAVLEALGTYEVQLRNLARFLETGDEKGLQGALHAIRMRRRAILT
jgi:prephenate dehydrogenase